MSAAELKELRKEVKYYIDHADERVVRMVYALLEADPKNEQAQSGLTPEQEALLDEHFDLYQKGMMKFSSWQDVKERVTEKIKNVI